jgi:hypothetical protein
MKRMSVLSKVKVTSVDKDPGSLGFARDDTRKILTQLTGSGVRSG